MTRPPRILVVEGNTQRARAKQTQFMGRTYSEGYSQALRAVAPDAVIDVCFPADEGANIPDPSGLESYDGVAVTGSALNIYKAEPESMRQVDLVRTVMETGVPMFGSCWGLQVAAVAAGGTVVKSDNGREIGLARKIAVTDEGRGHAMLAGKGASWDAPAVHTDEVGVIPEGMTVLASNRHSPVQAAEIRHGKGIFWGVQYHPEFSLDEIAAVFERYGQVLVDEGPFTSLDELNAHVKDLRALRDDPSRKDIAWRLAYDADVLDAKRRLTELRNFVSSLVLPTMSERGRG